MDEGGRFLGAVNLHDLNRELRRGTRADALRAADLVQAGFEATVPEERLDAVLDRFARQECERLPVLADLQSRGLVGTRVRAGAAAKRAAGTHGRPLTDLTGRQLAGGAIIPAVADPPDRSEAARQPAPGPDGLGHPRGTLALVIVYGVLFGLGWLAMYFYRFLAHGAPRP